MRSDDVELTNPILPDFWTQDPKVIDRELATIRSRPPAFYPEEPTESLGLPDGPGAWAVTQYDLILEMSRTPEIFSSAKGITILDLPGNFNEFFSSMIAMDDPRHGHLRRLVSTGFTPRILARLEDAVTVQANEIIDEASDRGECDFVVDVAARLPLAIVCDLMGVPRSELDFVFAQSNIILGATDPEYVPEAGDIVSALLTAGGALAELMTDVAASKKGGDGDDLTSILVNAEVDGEQLSDSDIASFFILLAVAETRRPETPSPGACTTSRSIPMSARSGRTMSKVLPLPPSRRSFVLQAQSRTCVAPPHVMSNSVACRSAQGTSWRCSISLRTETKSCSRTRSDSMSNGIRPDTSASVDRGHISASAPTSQDGRSA